jgi:hypothetical protein
MTPDDLNKHLSQHIDVVMKTYFPNAKRRGSSYAMGDLDGGEGQSTGVYPAKDKSTGESTNILKLVMRQVGNYHETQAEIKALLGITDIQTVAAAPKPEAPKVQIKPLTGSWAMDYLTKTRGLSTNTLRKYGVRSHSRNSSYNTDFYAFKFVSPDGDYVMLKSVGVHKCDKGRKDIWSTAAYATLWGWPTVDDTADQITICEGEIDACLSRAGVQTWAGSRMITKLSNDSKPSTSASITMKPERRQPMMSPSDWVSLDASGSESRLHIMISTTCCSQGMALVLFTRTPNHMTPRHSNLSMGWQQNLLKRLVDTNKRMNTTRSCFQNLNTGLGKEIQV